MTQRYHVRIRHGWRGSDVHAQIERMAALGFYGIEFFVDGFGHGDLGGTSKLHLTRVRQTIERCGMHCVITTNGTDPEHLRYVIRLASSIAADQVRTTVGSASLPDEAASAMQLIALPEVAKIARDLRNVAGLLETGGIVLRLARGRFLTSAALADIIQSVGHSNIEGEFGQVPAVSRQEEKPNRTREGWRESLAWLRTEITQRGFRARPMPWARDEAGDGVGRNAEPGRGERQDHTALASVRAASI